MMQAIGLCRFSYPAFGGFQVEHDSIEDRIAYLYEEGRLEERFQLFEAVALPCLRAQTDPNWQVVVVIGDQFPKTARDRLHDLIADIPQITVQAHAPKPQRQIMKDILQQARMDPSRPCLQFRYDDDDAVSVDFIERLRIAADDCRVLTRKNRAVGFDWHNGYVAEFSKNGISAVQAYRRQEVPAMAVQVRGGATVTIMNFSHKKIDRFMPMVSFGDAPMWIRSHNSSNDSRQKKVQPVPVEPLNAEEHALFKARFAIDVEHVKSVFSRS